jgi:hypothetical protein
MPKVIFWTIKIAALINLGLGIAIKAKWLKKDKQKKD